MKINNKIVSIIISLIYLVSAVAPVFAESNNITISDYQDLLSLSKKCSLDSWSKGKKVTLTKDIDLTNKDFNPIPVFTGVFDGGGYTISGINLDKNISINGFFVTVQSGGIVKNLNIKGNIISNASDVEVLGGICGENHGTIIDCSFDGKVTGDKYIGGICGKNAISGEIRSCNASGTMTGTHFTGGICGDNSGIIYACTNEASVNTTYSDKSSPIESIDKIDFENLNSTTNTTLITDTGGICGYSSGIIEYCTNNANIGYNHVGYNCGGICGRLSGYLSTCKNSGIILGRKDIGGICGQIVPEIKMDFSKDKLSQIRTKLSNMQAYANDLTACIKGMSNDISVSVDKTTEYVDSAIDSTENIANLLDTDVGNLSDFVKSDTAVLEKYRPNIVGINSQLQDSINTTRDAQKLFKETEDIADKLLDKYRLSNTIPNKHNLENAATEISVMASQLGAAASCLQKFCENIPTANTDTDFSELESSIEIIKTQAEILASADDLSKIISAVPAFSEALITSVNSISNILKNTDWLSIKDLYDNMNYLSSAVVHLQNGLDQVSGIASNLNGFMDKLDDAYKDFDDDFDKFRSSLKNTLDTTSEAVDILLNSLTALIAVFDNISSEISLDVPVFSSEYLTNSDNLTASLRGISGEVTQLNSKLQTQTDNIANDITSISNQFNDIMNLLLDSVEDAKNIDNYNLESHFEDISEDALYNAKSGKVTLCTNFGKVEGDINIGGVVGTMGIEYDLDPEDDIESGGKISYNSVYQTKAVLMNSVNYADVCGKKNSIGSVAGNTDIGTIFGCEGYGNVTSESGKYVGGVCGKSKSSVLNSYAKCTLSGKKYVGGICGFGTNIKNCVSIVNIPDTVAYCGAIAGYADGVISANKFTSDALAGIDRISSSGKAYPILYDELVKIENIPARFKTMTVDFVINGDIVKSVNFDYGQSISIEDIPKIPDKNGKYGKWSTENFENLVQDITVNAEYYPYITTLASSQLRNNTQSVLIALGNFSDKSTLDMSELTSNIKKAEETYHISLQNTNDSSNTIRFLPKDNKKYKLYVRCNSGKWEKVKAEKFGKYLSFDVSGNEFDIAVVKVNSFIWYLLAIFAVLFVTVLIVLKSTKKQQAV